MASFKDVSQKLKQNELFFELECGILQDTGRSIASSSCANGVTTRASLADGGRRRTLSGLRRHVRGLDAFRLLPVL